MKFYKYKQVARLTFYGYDDELLNNDSFLSNYFFKGGFGDNDVLNTKTMRFKLDSNMQNILLSNNARLVLESACIPDLFDWDRTGEDWVRDAAGDIDPSKSDGSIIVKIKNINGNNWDSSQKSNGNAVLFTYYDTNNNFFVNPDTEKLYNFSISNNFLRNGIVEFEIIYQMLGQQNIELQDNITNSRSIADLFISLVIYDIDEEELLLKDTENVDFALLKKHTNIF